MLIILLYKILAEENFGKYLFSNLLIKFLQSLQYYPMKKYGTCVTRYSSSSHIVFLIACSAGPAHIGNRMGGAMRLQPHLILSTQPKVATILSPSTYVPLPITEIKV